MHSGHSFWFLLTKLVWWRSCEALWGNLLRMVTLFPQWTSPFLGRVPIGYLWLPWMIHNVAMPHWHQLLAYTRCMFSTAIISLQVKFHWAIYCFCVACPMTPSKHFDERLMVCSSFWSPPTAEKCPGLSLIEKECPSEKSLKTVGAVLRGVEWVHGLFLFPLVLGKM